MNGFRVRCPHCMAELMAEEKLRGFMVRCQNCNTKFQVPQKPIFVTRSAEAIATDKSSFKDLYSQEKTKSVDYISNVKNECTIISFILIGFVGFISLIVHLSCDVNSIGAIFACACLIFISYKCFPLIDKTLENTPTTISSSALLDILRFAIYGGIIFVWVYFSNMLENWRIWPILIAISLVLFLVTIVTQYPERISMYIDEDNQSVENDYISLLIFIPKALMYILPFVLIILSIVWAIFGIHSLFLKDEKWLLSSFWKALNISIWCAVASPLALYIEFLCTYVIANIPANIAKIARRASEDQE